MIVFGNSAYSNLGWITSSSGKGLVSSTTLVTLVDTNAAPISDVMRGAGFKMILDSRSTSLYWGTPAASAVKVIVDQGQATQLVEFAYEKNAALMTGTAAARRVGFGVKVDSIQDLTIDGFKLLMAAVEWAGGPELSSRIRKGEPPCPKGNFQPGGRRPRAGSWAARRASRRRPGSAGTSGTDAGADHPITRDPPDGQTGGDGGAPDIVGTAGTTGTGGAAGACVPSYTCTPVGGTY